MSVSCNDRNCPFHGHITTHGKTFVGVVVKDRMQKTVVVRRDYVARVPKYERFMRKHSHISVHNPPCIDAKVGDIVRIAETRPISKTVSFVVVEKLGKVKVERM